MNKRKRSLDPTRTQTIRRVMSAKVKGRFNAFRRSLKALLAGVTVNNTGSSVVTNERPLKVAVVGGGPGGLFAAYKLLQAIPDVQITIFEATARLGGKVKTRSFAAEPGLRFEAGVAELYKTPNGFPDPLFDLIQELGLQTFDIQGAAVDLDGQWINEEGDVGDTLGTAAGRSLARFEQLCRTVLSPDEYHARKTVHPGKGHPWRGKTFEEILDMLDPDARRYVEAYTHSDVAAEPHQTNALYGAINYLMNHPEYITLYSIVGGIERLTYALASRLYLDERVTINLDHRVLGVAMLGDARRVTWSSPWDPGGQRSDVFDKVLVCLPAAWITRLDYDEQQEAVEQWFKQYDNLGSYLRVTLLFSKRFWDMSRGRFDPGEALFDDGDSNDRPDVLQQYWYMTDAFGGACVYDESARTMGGSVAGVLGWLIGGDAAVAMGNLSDEQLRDMCIASLPREWREEANRTMQAVEVNRFLGEVPGMPGDATDTKSSANNLSDKSDETLVFVGDYQYDGTLNGVLRSVDDAMKLLAPEEVTDNWCNQYGGDTCKTIGSVAAKVGKESVHLLGKASKVMVGRVRAAYGKFKERYGKAGAVAMIGAMAVTLPIPGNILAVIGVAEGVRIGAKLLAKNEQHDVGAMVQDMVEWADHMGLGGDSDLLRPKLREALLKQFSATHNAFCPTGDGGGIDPTCSPHGETEESLRKKIKSAKDPAKRQKLMDQLNQLLYPALHGGKAAAATTGDHGVQDRLRQAGVDPAAAPATWASANPLKYAGHVTQEQADKVFKAFQELKGSMSSFARPTIEQIHQKVGGSVRHLQEALYKLAGEGKVRLGPYTQALATLPVDSKYLMPLDREHKFYVDHGGKTTNAKRQSPRAAAFRKQLDAKIKTIFLSKQAKAEWTKLARDGYRKGIERAFTDVRGLGPTRNAEMAALLSVNDISDKAKARTADIARYAADQSTADFYEGSKAEFLASAFDSEVSQERMDALAEQNFEYMQGVTDDMADEMASVLEEGLAEGKGVDELTADMMDRVGVAETRAETIARTEIITAHAEGQLTSLENLGVTELGVDVELATAGDDAVCEECDAAAADSPYTIDEARGVIPVHPRCRCAWIPYVPDEEEATKNQEADEPMIVVHGGSGSGDFGHAGRKGEVGGSEKGGGDKEKFVGETVGWKEREKADKIEQDITRALGFELESDYKFYDAKSADNKHFVEIKSSMKGAKNVINAHEDALLRKVEGMAANKGATFHTVFQDERNTYENGAHADKYSGHKLYYKRGNGRYALSQMHQVKNMAELKQLVNMPDSKLPDKAKGSLPSGAELSKLKVQAAKASESRKARDANRRAKAKAEGRNIYERQT